MLYSFDSTVEWLSSNNLAVVAYWVKSRANKLKDVKGIVMVDTEFFQYLEEGDRKKFQSEVISYVVEATPISQSDHFSR